MRKNVTKAIRTRGSAEKDQWGGKNDTIMLIHIDHEDHTIEMEKVSGCDPSMDDLINIVMYDRDIIKELVWAATKWTRKNKLVISDHTGYSGCVDIVMKSIPKDTPDWKLGWRYIGYDVFNLHISMFGKVPKFDKIFSGDLLDLMGYMVGSEFIKTQIMHIVGHNMRGFYTWHRPFKYIKYIPEERSTFDSICGSIQYNENLVWFNTPDDESENV